MASRIQETDGKTGNYAFIASLKSLVITKSGPNSYFTFMNFIFIAIATGEHLGLQ